MKAVLQRVSRASVSVDGVITGAIERGLLVLLGAGKGDAEPDADYLAAKILALRIFSDDAGKMNRDIAEIGGGLLVVSQFTLYADCRKGRRPSFDAAAPAEEARRLYDYFVTRLKTSGLRVETGVFQAHMDVLLVNDGPVTLLLDSKHT